MYNWRNINIVHKSFSFIIEIRNQYIEIALKPSDRYLLCCPSTQRQN